MTKKFLKLKTVADQLSLSERSVIRYIKKGELRAAKIGQWRILESDLEKFIKSKMKRRKKSRRRK